MRCSATVLRITITLRSKDSESSWNELDLLKLIKWIDIMCSDTYMYFFSRKMLTSNFLLDTKLPKFSENVSSLFVGHHCLF